MIGSSLNFIHKVKKGGTTFLAAKLKAVPLPLTREENFLSVTPEGGASVSYRFLQRLPDNPNFYRRARMLNNVVEELSVAALMPVPDVYILPNQSSINAMAMGPFQDDGAIVVTLGALKRLTRDELTAMVAHEMSHLSHGDGVFFAKLSGWMYGLVSTLILGARLMHVSHYAIFLGGIFFATGSVSSLIAKIAQTAYSRERELLADARAVEFIRSRENLAAVLKKIGGLKDMGFIRSSSVPLFRHFFLANPEKRAIFSTHPPLDERILILDPNWDGTYYDFIKNPVDFIKPDVPPLPHFPGDRTLPREPFVAPEIISPKTAELGHPSPTPLPQITLAPFAIAMTRADKTPLAHPGLPKEDPERPRPKARLYEKAQRKAEEISRRLKEEAEHPGGL
jgi:Zn-dependent protease with chaperone function